MSRSRSEQWVLILSIIVALLAGLISVPNDWETLRPFWVGLLVVYWSLEAPERMGLGLAFLIGLWADVLFGSALGEHPIRLCVLCFLVLRFRARLRFFPVAQQALAVGLLLLNDRVIALALAAALGESMPGPSFWLAPLTGAVIWPWLYLALDHWRMQWRLRHG